MTHVMLASPSYDGRVNQGLIFNILHILASKKIKLSFKTVESSLLPRTFNHLWAACLMARKEGVTHFLMMHDDIVAEPQFLDSMLKIMEEKKASVLSAVVPIKNTTGLTSTALDDEKFDGSYDDHWRTKRFTIKQLQKMPETFTDPKLLINTGLMLVDMRKPWVEKICFKFEDDIIKKPDGTPRVVGISEDWYFSREAKKLGATLWATRAIHVNHVGKATYTNQGAWGTLEVDNLNVLR